MAECRDFLLLSRSLRRGSLITAAGSSRLGVVPFSREWEGVNKKLPFRWIYPNAPVVRVVLDNLNTHRVASLYETFPAAEARRIVKRLEFHHTPKHASWLNMAEIEFSALSRACLKGRNPDADALERAITAYKTRRNTACVPINWRFSTDHARTKLHRFYPCLSKVD